MLGVISKKANLLLVILILAITGCNGDSGIGSSSNEIKDPIPEEPIKSNVLYSVQDTMRHTQPREIFYVDLTNNMESSDGTPVAVLSVESLNPDFRCDVVSYDQNGFFIKAAQVNMCDYRFRSGSSVARMSTATSSNGYSEATARVAIAENNEQLMPISSTTSTGVPTQVNVKSELAKLGYSVDTSRYTLSTTLALPNADSTRSSAVSDPANNTIEYTPGPGLEAGVERILYSYSDGVNVLSGSLDISVSTIVNGAPTASDQYIRVFTDPDTSEVVSEVPYEKTVTIDVLSLVYDPDGDSLQLIDVYAYDADVAILEDSNLDGNLFNDTAFTFTTSKPGYHYITYVVSDNKGGYATGIIKVKSEGLYPIIPFEHIDVFVSPPLTIEQAEASNIEFEAIGTGDGTNAVDNVTTIAHTKGVAEAICSSRGDYLPSQTDLQRFYDWKPSGQIFADYRYPNDKPYWTRDQVDDVNTTLVNLLDGSVTASNNEEVNYVLCVSSNITPVSLSLDGRTSIQVDLYEDVTELYQATVTYSTGESEVVPAEFIQWTITNPAGPSISNFDKSTGILTAYSSIYTQPLSLVHIQACFSSLCDVLEVLLYPPLGITSYEGNDFLPLLTRDQAVRYSGNDLTIPGVLDSRDYSYEIIKKYGYLGSDNFLESPHTKENTGEYCSKIMLDGGGWKQFPDETIARKFANAWNSDEAFKGMISGRLYSHPGYLDEFWFRGNGFLYKYKLNNIAENEENGGITYYRGPESTIEATGDYSNSPIHVYLSCYR